MKLYFRTPERLLQVEGNSKSIHYLDRQLEKLAKLEGKEPNQVLGEDEHPSIPHHSSEINKLDFRISDLVCRMDRIERMSDEEKTIGYQHLEQRIKNLEQTLTSELTTDKSYESKVSKEELNSIKAVLLFLSDHCNRRGLSIEKVLFNAKINRPCAKTPR